MSAPRPDWRWPRHIAHRGGGTAAPENTLGAIDLAARRGFRAVEFDVRLAADGVPVVIHDETLERTTGRPGRVADHTAQQLAQLAAVRGHDSSAWPGQAIPELGLLLLVVAARGLCANLELKGGEETPDRLVAAVATRLAELAWALPAERLLVSAFEPQLLAAARHHLPGIRRALLCEALGTRELGIASALECVAINPAVEACTATGVAAAHAAGLAVCAWTVTRPDQDQALFALGVDTVFTDRIG